jgi:uncharacterized protein YceH (UPF0502 family)
MTLDSVQIRVLGTLIEKEITTPENYPLSLNALVAGCNQRSSRDPVMELTEEEVRQALHSLEDLGLTATVRDSRVAKYEHRIRTVLNLRRDETAVVCLLFLRGAQTAGELRARADRLYSFDGIEGVESTLARLVAQPGSSTSEEPARVAELRPLVAVLPRQPGSREARYVHLLGVRDAVSTASRDVSPDKSEAGGVSGSGPIEDRMRELESEVAALRATVARIEDRLDQDSSDSLKRTAGPTPE